MLLNCLSLVLFRILLCLCLFSFPFFELFSVFSRFCLFLLTLATSFFVSVCFFWVWPRLSLFLSVSFDSGNVFLCFCLSVLSPWEWWSYPQWQCHGKCFLCICHFFKFFLIIGNIFVSLIMGPLLRKPFVVVIKN